MDRKELENDYVKRWGNAQKCSSCGYVMSYGEFSKKQICCGKEMELVKKTSHSKETYDKTFSMYLEIRISS